MRLLDATEILVGQLWLDEKPDAFWVVIAYEQWALGELQRLARQSKSALGRQLCQSLVEAVRLHEPGQEKRAHAQTNCEASQVCGAGHGHHLLSIVRIGHALQDLRDEVLIRMAELSANRCQVRAQNVPVAEEGEQVQVC